MGDNMIIEAYPYTMHLLYGANVIGSENKKWVEISLVEFVDLLNSNLYEKVTIDSSPVVGGYQLVHTIWVKQQAVE